MFVGRLTEYAPEVGCGVRYTDGDFEHMGLAEALRPFLDRRVEELSQVEKALLRIGAFELKERLDVPYRVVINESIELAKVFGADDSFKYVNGVLDKLARRLRSAETAHRPAASRQAPDDDGADKD